jgi:hypothetical protein
MRQLEWHPGKSPGALERGPVFDIIAMSFDRLAYGIGTDWQNAIFVCRFGMTAILQCSLNDVPVSVQSAIGLWNAFATYIAVPIPHVGNGCRIYDTRPYSVAGSTGQAVTVALL